MNGQMIMYGHGPIMQMGNYNFVWNNAWVVTWLLGMVLVHYAIPIPFVYRYLLLCR